MNRLLCSAAFLAIAMTFAAPRIARGGDAPITDQADANAAQVLELPQACTADGATFSCDDSRTAPLDASANHNGAADSNAPQAAASAAADAADDLQLGSVRDYENEGITEAPLPPSALVTSGPPVTFSRSTFGTPGYTPLTSMSTYVPPPPFMIPAPVAMGRPVGSTAIGPAGAPMWGPSRGFPMLGRPFPGR